MKRKFYTAFFVFIFLMAVSGAYAQPLSFNYNVTGYVFHPTSSRSFSLKKVLSETNEASRTYEGFMADFSTSFTFSLDDSNHVVNFRYLSSSFTGGLMTADNPGGYPYYPDTTTGFTSDVYNNTYDSATKTFYLHYGYNLTYDSTTGQASYTRQIYEKWQAVATDETSPYISSFSPQSGTFGTIITAKGTDFLRVSVVLIGGVNQYSFTALSDTEMVITAENAKTGSLEMMDSVSHIFSIGTADFVYTPPVVTDTTWKPAGNMGFSAGSSNYVSIATAPSGLPYVVYQDKANGNKAMVMRLDAGGTWQAVGGAASDGAVSYTNIAVGTDGVPYIAYIDSAISRNKISVQRFVNGTWEYVGTRGIDSISAPLAGAKVALALDNANRPYVLSVSGAVNNYSIHALYFDGSRWQALGGSLANYYLPFISALGDADLAIDPATNSVYVVSDKRDSGYKATVVKFENGSWQTIGGVFGGGINGAYYLSIKIDYNGIPVVSMQDDDGRERVSVYRFAGRNWQPVGDRYFTDGHCYYVAMAIDGRNIPYVLYQDYSYNGLGTVMKKTTPPDTTLTGWVTVGARGFANSAYYTAHAIVYSPAGHMYVAFPDSSQGYKVTVLQVDAPPYSVLPVSMVSFSAKADGNRNAIVSWQTSSAVNAAYFTVQRSVDGVLFTDRSKVMATNTGGSHTYRYNDDLSDVSAATVYYRLQTVDKDGSVRTSGIVSVTLTGNKLITIQPNPTHSYAVISCSVAGKKTITVMDMSGKKVFAKSTANMVETVPVSSFAKGTYFVMIDYAGGSEIKKLIVE